MMSNTSTPTINKILYVDDDPGLLEIGKIFLESNGTLSVTTYLSASAALDHLNSASYDAIVSDFEMPRMNGIQFLKNLRERDDTTPFIIFTGRGREEVVIDALNSGADFYLQKGGAPTAQFAELEHKILHAISRKRADLALKKSEQDYRKLIEHAGEAIFVTQDELFKLVNPQLISLSGYSEPELLNQPFTRFVHPDNAGILLDNYRKRMAGSNLPTHYIFRIIRKDETIRWVELNVVVITWDERPAILNFMIDITDRKLAEDALKESEERYRHLIEHAGEGIYVVQDEILQMVNPQTTALSGYSEQELLGKPFKNFVHPADFGVLIDRFKRRINGETVPSRYPFRLSRKDGTIKWVELSVVTIKWNDAAATLNYVTDITDRKLAEDALKESEEQYRLFFKTSQDSVFISGTDGKYIDFNDNLFERLGCRSREEALSIDVASTYAHPEERAPFLELVRREGYVREYPIAFRKRDGTDFDTLISIVARKNPDGSTKAFFGTVRDITERKRAEAALKESEERYRTIFESFEDLYYQTDTNGIITILSPSLNRLTGWTGEELIGEPITKIYANPEDRQILLNELAEKGYVRDYEVLLRKRDGTETPVSLSANRIFHPDGSPSGVAGIIRDITRRKQAEDALRESEVKFRSLVDHALEAIMITDMQGKVLFCNNAAARTVDAENCEDLISRNVMEVIAPESRADVVKDFEEVARGHDAYIARYHLISLKGRDVFVESIGRVITYEGRPADIISLREVAGQTQRTGLTP
ncbi:PAS domain S-box protein [Methanoregula sp.]|uniref:PAS domain S-box protein n=1 Tax=Methanoregula sp. TaxID=2052170 RepID=UPI00236B50EF|nr:PAS domain S-box protein [Methanoregula sp.]MDD1687480.1 PAS domain S-box protein [Methanoregula sp.]